MSTTQDYHTLLQIVRDRGLGFPAVFSFILGIADIFTKGLHSPIFLTHCRHLHLVGPDQSQIPG
ncbi:hypothetical protein C1H46_029671 [Malus baccata]|uniref:Uncharacterized protein n=1 Tax=Malus baccata TaxID=106549 RepID=A0A540LE41_MALBA|nr:hypothetical protein C1H46_029671 [Malus baccata]